MSYRFFEPVEGKYSIVELDAASDNEDNAPHTLQPGDEGYVEPAESELSPEVQELVDLVCNKQLLKDTMSSLNIDTERFPLGRLSQVTERASVGCHSQRWIL